MPIRDLTRPSTRKRTKTLATDFRAHSAVQVSVLTDQFVPVRSEVEVRVRLSAAVYGLAMGQFRLLVGAGNVAGPALRSTNRYWTPAAGVTEYPVGTLSYNESGTVALVFHVTGLTPGSTYTWSLDVVIVGGSDPIAELVIHNGPHQVAMSPDEKVMAVTNFDGNNIAIQPVAQTRFAWATDVPEPTTSFLPYYVTGVTQPLGVAFTPDGTKLCVTSYASRTLTTFDTTTWAVISTTAALGTAGAEPWDVQCTSNTTGYVSLGNGQLAKVTLATGTVTNTFSPGGTALRYMCHDSTNSLLYLAEYGDDKVYKWSTSSDTVTGTATLTSGDNPMEPSLTPDGAQLYVACANFTNAAKRIQTSDMSVQASCGMPFAVASTNAQCLKVSPDGHSAVVGFDNGVVAWLGTSTATKRDVWFDEYDLGATTVAGVWLDSMGNIIATEYHDDTVQLWPGADVLIRAATGGDFFEEAAYVEVVGAS